MLITTIINVDHTSSTHHKLIVASLTHVKHIEATGWKRTAEAVDLISEYLLGQFSKHSSLVIKSSSSMHTLKYVVSGLALFDPSVTNL